MQVARQLIGKYLMRRYKNHFLIGKIVEVEAYLGEKDPASHAYNGKTKRNEVMFWNGGHLYVYFTYGMHFCSNVVTEQEGIGHAVLLRAVEPIGGLEVMARNRHITLKAERDKSQRDKPRGGKQNLCNGPAKLCEAFAIEREENGVDLCGDEIWIAEVKRRHTQQTVSRSTRVGITRGKQHQWRFFLRNNPYVSTGKPVQ